MENVVLYYFPAKGLGEGLRMLLSYGGQVFEDRRIHPEEWPEFKPQTPFGQMPVIEINGRKYGQALAIARYLGRRYGLAGDTAEESLEIDQNMDFITDLREEAVAVIYESDPDVKAKKQAEKVQNVYPALFDKLDVIIKKNNGHLAAGKLTWADFVFAGLFDAFKIIFQIPEFEKKYPSFLQVIDAVHSLPEVKAYLEKAPKTEY